MKGKGHNSPPLFKLESSPLLPIRPKHWKSKDFLKARVAQRAEVVEETHSLWQRASADLSQAWAVRSKRRYALGELPRTCNCAIAEARAHKGTTATGTASDGGVWQGVAGAGGGRASSGGTIPGQGRDLCDNSSWA